MTKQILRCSMEKSAEQGNGEKGQSATESVKRLLKSRQKKKDEEEELVSGKGKREFRFR